MELIKSIVLGIIQGLTEFLPVSSSGHLVIAEHFMRFDKPDMSFDVLLHFGTLLAILLYFRNDIINLLKSLNPSAKGEAVKDNRRVLLYLIIGTIPIGLVGVLLKDPIEGLFSNPMVAATMLFFTGAIVLVSDLVRSRGIEMGKMGILRCILIGIGQALAIVPGISRSGMTISSGLFAGLKRDDAARYAFLLAIPAILGATVLDIGALFEIEPHYIVRYIAGTIAAFGSGYAVISLLLSMVRKQKMKYFSFYCWAVAIVTIILIWKGL